MTLIHYVVYSKPCILGERAQLAVMLQSYIILIKY